MDPSYDDPLQARERIYGRVQDAYASAFPIENDRYRLELADLAYDPPPPSSFAQQRRAIIGGRTLHRALRGTWRLVDKASNTVVDERTKALVARVPHMTERGTFVYNGNEYTLATQMRLRPGVYTRRKENGEYESHFNVKPGTGPSFRLHMEPESGKFHMTVGQAKIPLYPLLRAAGVTDRQLSDAWGSDLLAANTVVDGEKHISKAFDKLVGKRARAGLIDSEPDRPTELKLALDRMELDPEVMRDTLGRPYDRVSADVLLKATAKLRGILRGDVDTDDRDNVAYQTVMGPEELFAERVRRDHDRVNRNLLWKATHVNALTPVADTNLRTKQLENVLLNSGLGMALEEVNPLEIYDQRSRISRMGFGGIPSDDAIPDESRAVQPSYLGLIDPVRTSESERSGVDNRLSLGAEKGDDGQLYATLLDRRGQPVKVSAREMSRSVIAFPGERRRARAEDRPVRAMSRGQIVFVDPGDVDYELASPDNMTSGVSNLIPFLSSVRGHRMLMTSKMFSQALPLDAPEAPLVQSRRGDDPDDSYERWFGERVGAVRAAEDGWVTKVGPDEIELRTASGVKRVQLYNNFPFNRKTYQHNTPVVQPGQRVSAGDLLARSNFTDNSGDLALGRNLRVGYLPFKGATYEDAIVISDSAAKKLSSVHMYQYAADIGENETVSKSKFVSAFPGAYSRDVLRNFDDNGVVRVGTRVKKDDPLILSVRARPHKGQGVLHRSSQRRWDDATRTWDYDSEGVVTDVDVGGRGVNVVVRTVHPTEVGDKLVNRYASKGVVSRVVPDDQMPRDADGRPLEILLQPFGVISRGNPGLMLEAALGKVAAKTGRTYRVPLYSDDDYVSFVQSELRKNGLSDTEDLYDPERNAKIPNVFTGVQHFMKLAHRAEDKISGRGDEGAYTAERIPARVGEESSKRIGALETMSLLSGGATETLRDAKLIRGQMNDEFWRAFRMGLPPPTPEPPFVYRKFFDDLVAAGINVRKEGNYVHIMPLTDKDTLARSRGAVTDPKTLDFDTMDPLKGGLFDLGLTGGHSGTGWTHVPLSEPLPNPVMEDPIRNLLGLTREQYRDVLAGKRDIDGKIGGDAVRSALDRIHVGKAIQQQLDIIRNGVKTRRDGAIKRLRTLTMLNSTGIKPADLVLSHVPVLPPQYRPIRRVQGRVVVSDPNWMYKELMLADDNLRKTTAEVGAAHSGEERLALYDAFKALTGLGDPVQPELQSKGIRGILSHALGLRHSPKFGDVQRKLIGSSTDLVGRGVITPDPALSMDQVGIPEDKAWKLFRPFVVRDLTRRGVSASDALRMVVQKDKRAREALLREMERRPVLINRAPTLHRFGIMAAYAQPVTGNTLRVSPLTTSGFGADFDGDTMQFHVPVSDEAVREAREKLLPSQNLIHPRTFDVHYMPSQEFLHGLFEATDRPRKGKEPRAFRSARDVELAYRRGEIGVNDPVKIHSS